MRVDTGSGSTIQYLCKYSKDRIGPSLCLQMSLKWKERQVCGKEEPPLRDLDSLGNWANKNCMRFNKDKYEVLHLEWNNLKWQNRLGTDWLQRTWGFWGTASLT